MHLSATFLLTTSLLTYGINSQSAGFFPMSPRQDEDEPQELKKIVHPFFTSPKSSAVIDIAVPEEQRLYHEFQDILESRPIAFGVRNFRKSFSAARSRNFRRPTESEDSVKESSVSEHGDLNFTLPSLGYRPPPPPVRRNVEIPPRCHYDTDKWALHMESTLTYAVMFDRKTGISCEQCLQRCIHKQTGVWTCRSVIYDSTWHICDMFAVAATAAPFTLVDYEGRDYFEYLAAQPPSDDELSQASDFARGQQLASPETNDAKCVNEQNKAFGSKTEVPQSRTYDAIPVDVQVEVFKQKIEKKEKERRKKEGKLQKVGKDERPFTTSLPITEAEALVTVYPIPESQFTTVENERVTIASDEKDPDEEAFTEYTTTEIESTASAPENFLIKDLREVKDNKKKREKQNEHRSISPSQNKASDESEHQRPQEKIVPRRQRQKSKTRKVIRRKPAKIILTNATLVTTTEMIQELSSDVARKKIKQYQQRKAAENEQARTLPRKRRVRIEGRRLYGDFDERAEVVVKTSSKQHGSSHDITAQYKRKNVKDSAEDTLNEALRRNKKDDKKVMKKRISRGETLEELSKEPSFSPALQGDPASIVHPDETINSGNAPNSLRNALAKEIRKFISKELKQKLHRVHGTHLHGESEDITVPSELISMSSKPQRKQERDRSSNVCEEHEQVVMMTFAKSTRNPYTVAIETVKARDQKECVDMCRRSPDCSSAVFSSSLCEMSATRARHTIPDIRPSINDSYIEKACVDTDVIRGRVTDIVGVANHILAGYVEQVEDAYGVEQCIAACYMAMKQYGFHCMSAMWYPIDKQQNCLLNSESRKSQPDLFIAEDTGHQMIYFEHPDAAFFRRMQDDTSLRKNSSTQYGWTEWSSCHSNRERFRYSKCKEYIDVRKCAKETAECGSNLDFEGGANVPTLQTRISL